MENTTTQFVANFTFVDGVRNHEYELHATGCRDLKKLSLASVRWSVDAAKAEDALAEFLAETNGTAKVFTQACCNPKRMAAAGRLRPATLPEVPTEEAPIVEAPIVEEPIAEAPAEVVDAPAEGVTEEVPVEAPPVRKGKKGKKAA